MDGDSIQDGKLNPIASCEGFMFTTQRNKVSLWKQKWKWLWESSPNILLST